MGTPWDFQEPFCFYPWEPGTGLCTPQSPIENPEAEERNAKCQWSDCTSTFGKREKERDEGAGPDRPLFCYIAKQGQKWNSAHPVQGVHPRTLNGSLRTDPGLRTKGRSAKQKAWKCRSRQNEWDRFFGRVFGYINHMWEKPNWLNMFFI